MTDATPVADVGANVAAEMRRRRLTATDLLDAVGERTGLTGSALGRRLNGHVEFRADELIAIAEALGVPVARLLGEEAKSA